MNALGAFFLNPLNLAFLGLIPIVVLLYILKLRRTEVVIPSTMLWMKSLQDLTANAPFQRLRKNLLLFLQILILALLALALARPFITAEGTTGANLCVVIDRSASMQTVEGDETRLAQAKERARMLIDSLESGDRMMIVSYASTADVHCELTDDQGRLRTALDSIEAADTRSNIRDVMLIVRSLAPDNPDIAAVVPDLEVFLLSDGKLSDGDSLGEINVPVNFMRVGETRENAGITGFALREPQGVEGPRQAFIGVHNERENALETTVTLYYEDDALAVEELTVDAESVSNLVFALPDLDTGMLRAEIDGEDVLAMDNRAWLALRPPERIRTLIVSDSDAGSAYFLRRALALDARVELSAITPDDYADTGNHDLTIFVGWTPEVLPAGTLLFINAVPPMEGLVAGDPIENPPVMAPDRDHPIMRFLSPGNIGIAQAIQVTLPEGARSLLSSRETPLIADISTGLQRVLLLSFDIADTNWPVQLSFPLFVQNLLAWTPLPGSAAQASIMAGKPIELPAVPEGGEATVTHPDGTTSIVKLDPSRPVQFAATEHTGPYLVTVGERETAYAVNLLDKNETSIIPAETLEFGKAELAAITGAMQFDRELWPWLVLAGLAILMIEWWIYSYRAHG